MGDNVFCRCERLKHVTFAKGNQLEKIGKCCFGGSGIEEITLPSTLKEIGNGTFDSCTSLKRIYVEDGCEANLINVRAPDSTCVIPLSTARIGDVSL